MSSAAILTRSESPPDCVAVRAVMTAAFPSAVEANLVDLLRDHDRLLLSLLAVADGEVVGAVCFSPATLVASDGTEQTGAALAPVAVLPAWQRRGIGAHLIREGLAQLRAQGLPWVVLLGDPNYYGRFGFLPTASFNVTSKYDAFAPAVQLLPLAEGEPRGGGGSVRWCPEFSQFE